MALPTRAGRGDIVLMVNWAGTGTTFTNFCGASGITLTLNNEIQSENVGDCLDWTLPVVVVKEYGAQNASATINGTWAAENNDDVLLWALEQKKLPVRIHFVNAAVGKIEYLDGVAMLASTDISDIGNVTGAKVSRALQIEFDGPLTPELAVA